MIKKSFILFAACLLISFLLRSYSLYGEIIQIDEADFSAQGYLAAQGAIPYVDFVEKKPVLSYYFFALPFYFFGWNIIGVHILLIFWVSLTAFFLYKIAALYSMQKEGVLIALGYCVLSVCFPTKSTLGATPVNMMNLPSVVACFFYLLSIKKQQKLLFFLAGVFVAFASLFKHQGGILLMTFFGHLFFLYLRKEKTLGNVIRSLMVICLGFFSPWFILGAIYFRMDYLAEFLEWNFINNIKYIESGLSFYSKLIRFLQAVSTFFLSIFPAAFGCYYFIKEKSDDDKSLAYFLLIWALTVFLAVCVGGRFLNQYFVQLFPVYIFTGVLGLFKFFQSKRVNSFFKKTGFIILILFPTIWSVFHWIGHFARVYEVRSPMVEGLSGYVKAISSKQDKIFVWGYFPYVYYLSQREPGTRFIICEYLVPFWTKIFQNEKEFKANELSPWYQKNHLLLLKDLEKNKPRFIIDTSTSDTFPQWHMYQFEKFPDLNLYISKNYVKQGEYRGVSIYERVKIDF